MTLSNTVGAGTKCLVAAGCMIGLNLAAVHPAEAVPVQFGTNFYEFIAVPDPFIGLNNHWNTARDAAAATVFNGVSGHLATITSQAENDFLFGLGTGNFTGFAGAWLGGKAPEGWLVGPEAGQPFSYTNWGGIEPNNAGFAYMSIGTTTAVSQWLDDSQVQGLPQFPNDPVVGYFVEFEGPFAVPEPATTWLLGAGVLAVLAGARRRRNKTTNVLKS